MYDIRYLSISLLALVYFLSPLEARKVKRARSPALDYACTSNSECLQKGLSPLPPRHLARRHIRRQTFGQAFEPISTTTCGIASTAFLPTGTYEVSLIGASGSIGRSMAEDFNLGGRGAKVGATFTVSNNITVGYIVGCAGSLDSNGRVGGGGGGSFIYLIGVNEPAVLVAGGGGGGGFSPNGRGRNAVAFPEGIASRKDGTVGAGNGQGGAISTDEQSASGGTGGGGFISAGASTDYATGGSQSFNYGGDFSGGRTGSLSSGRTTGGAGGGGGAGFWGGGGSGGYSGGGGGDGTLGNDNSGGGGGGSFISNSSPGGIAVTFSYANLGVAATTGQGSLTITKS